MPNIQMLNNVEHQNVRIITDRSADYGDDVHFVMTFPIEFRRVQACFPIFFQKDASNGKFFPMALLGVEEGHNLFLGEDGWDASYVPLMLQRGPFLIGFQQDEEAPGGKRSMVSIDMDNPRISDTEGEALFLPHGGTSDYLSSMTRILEDIQYGHQVNEAFVDALLEFDLIESVAMEVELDNGSKRQLLGLYTINEDRLEQLDGEALGKLHGKHYLLPIYMILASLSCFRTLIDKMNDKLPKEQ